MAERPRRIRAAALLLSVAVLSMGGCRDKHPGLVRMKTGYMSHDFLVHPAGATLSFIKGGMGFKTVLFELDLASSKTLRRVHMKNVVFLGPHVFLPGGHVLAAVRQLSMERMGASLPKVAVLDPSGDQFVHARPFSDAGILALFIPPALSRPLVLLQKESTLFFEEIDPVSGTFSDPIEITGRLHLSDAARTFHENQDLLGMPPPPVGICLEGGGDRIVVETIDGGRTKLLYFDFQERRPVAQLDVGSKVSSLTASSTPGVFYGVGEVLKENRQAVLSIDFPRRAARVLAQLDGEVESLLEVDGKLYVLAKDIIGADQGKRSWLQPRNLFIIDPSAPAILQTIPWSERYGQLVGWKRDGNQLIYAVMDNDRPALWLVNNDQKTLADVKEWI